MSDLIHIRVDPPYLEVQPGKAQSATITLRNRSEEVAEYVVQPGEGAPQWARINPDRVSAFPNDLARSQILIEPPTDTSAATYHIPIRAYWQAHPDEESGAFLQVQVNPAERKVQSGVSRVEAPVAQERAPQTASAIQISADPVPNAGLTPLMSQWRVVIRNQGSVLDTFRLAALNVPADWVTFDRVEVTLKPNESGTTQLTIRPNLEADPNRYRVRLVASSAVNPEERTEVPLDFQLSRRAGFRLSLAPREAESQGARDFKITLQGESNSNVDTWFDLTASDPNDACEYILEPSALLLLARQSATAKVTVRPPALDAPNERRSHSFTVVATPRDGTIPSQSTPGLLVHLGAVPLRLGLQPQVKNSDREALYRVIVTNPASVEAVLTLSAEDPALELEYQFRPPSVTVAPRSQSQVELNVKARSLLDGKEPRTIPFSVQATRRGGLIPEAQTEGRLIQLPKKGRSMALPLVALLLAVVGLVACAFVARWVLGGLGTGAIVAGDPGPVATAVPSMPPNPTAIVATSPQPATNPTFPLSQAPSSNPPTQPPPPTTVRAVAPTAAPTAVPTRTPTRPPPTVAPSITPRVTDFSGRWTTNIAVLELTQNGDRVNGSFQGYGDTHNGVISGRVIGNVLRVDNNPVFGTSAFTQTSDGTSFTSTDSLGWCGTRAGPLPDGCGYSGTWNLRNSRNVVPAGSFVVLVQTGSSVRGMVYDSGRQSLAEVVGDVEWGKGYSLDGYSDAFGSFSWYMGTDMFTGPAGNNTSRFCGWRAGKPAPNDCGF